MRSNWMRHFSLLFVVYFVILDCPIVKAEEGKKQDRMSSHECMPGDEEEKAKKEIQAKYNRLFSYYDIDNDKKMPQLEKKRRQKNFQKLGFKNVENLKDVEVRDCLELWYVRLDQLRNYKPGESDPKSLINQSHTYVFPVNASFEVKVLKENEKDGSEKFPTIQVGPSDGFKSLFEAKFTGCSKCFGVYINGLQQYLLGDYISGEFKLQIPGNSMGGQSLKMKKGEFLPADVVFKELSMEARKKKYEWPPWPFGQPRTRPRPQPQGGFQ